MSEVYLCLYGVPGIDEGRFLERLHNLPEKDIECRYGLPTKEVHGIYISCVESYHSTDGTTDDKKSSAMNVFDSNKVTIINSFGFPPEDNAATSAKWDHLRGWFSANIENMKVVSKTQRGWFGLSSSPFELDLLRHDDLLLAWKPRNSSTATARRSNLLGDFDEGNSNNVKKEEDGTSSLLYYMPHEENFVDLFKYFFYTLEDYEDFVQLFHNAAHNKQLQYGYVKKPDVGLLAIVGKTMASAKIHVDHPVLCCMSSIEPPPSSPDEHHRQLFPNNQSTINPI